MIARETTRSFRELSQKLLQQNKELIQYAKDVKSANKKHEHEKQQLKLELSQELTKSQE